jgi:hypothetical protein
MARVEAPADPPRRERSARYPQATLDQSIELARNIAEKGVDGLPAEAIAAALGYKNIRTHSFSSALSSARQFGLIVLKDGGYALTDLARQVFSGRDPSVRRRAFRMPPLYSELCERFAGKRMPEAPALANWLQHNHQITAAAKLQAAETFLASAREAAVLSSDAVLRLDAPVPPSQHEPRSRPTAPAQQTSTEASATRVPSAEVEFTLRLWGGDAGKEIRVAGPAVMTAESYERLLQAFRLHIRIEPTS